MAGAISAQGERKLHLEEAELLLTRPFHAPLLSAQASGMSLGRRETGTQEVLGPPAISGEAAAGAWAPVWEPHTH